MSESIKYEPEIRCPSEAAAKLMAVLKVCGLNVRDDTFRARMRDDPYFYSVALKNGREHVEELTRILDRLEELTAPSRGSRG